MVVKGDDNYIITRKAGRNIVERRPTFTPDGKCLLVIVENVVRVYDVQTGECTRVLETEAEVDSLVSVQFADNDAYNLHGCSDTGLVTIWTWAHMDGAVLREVDLSLPLEHKVLAFELIDNKECFVVSSKEGEGSCNLTSYSLVTGNRLTEYKCVNVRNTGMICVSLGYCNGDKYAALCNGTKYLFIQNLIQPHLGAEIINQNIMRVVSVSAHPKDNAVAITDTLGRVTIFRGYLFNYNNLAKEVMHWHFMPTLASHFSAEGSYLYTGGIEKVLIKWTLGNLARQAQEKQFMPRLPGTVKYITSSFSHVAVSLTNNCILIASPGLHVTQTILECGGLSPYVRKLGPTLAYHRPTGSLVLGGRTGHLQMYSTVTDKLLYNLDITQTNHVPATRENLLPLELEVICAAVSANGYSMATSEYRDDGYMYPEERLKFYQSRERGMPFKLNTCVNLSHGGCKVISLALSEKGDFCVSSGTDQKFRVWTRENIGTGRRNKFSWMCLTACYYSSGFSYSMAHEIMGTFKNSMFNKGDADDKYAYQTVRSETYDIVSMLYNANTDEKLVEKERVLEEDAMMMGSVAISQDGSLIAAWYGAKLTLWDTHQSELKTTLSHPSLRPKGLHVQFGNNDAAHYLVCTTQSCLAVWSLLSLTMKWRVNIEPSCLAADPFSNRFALITQDNGVFVFTPHSSKPILSRPYTLNDNKGVFTQCAFSASTKDELRLYMVRNDTELYCLEPESTKERLEVVSHRNVPKTNFQALIAEQQLSEVNTVLPPSLEHLDSNGLTKSAIAQFMSSAPHMMPPVTLLSTPFLEHISGREIIKEQVDLDMSFEPEEQSSDEEDNVSPSTKKSDLWTPNYEAVKRKKSKKIEQAELLDEYTVNNILFAE